jgi:cytochrome c553
MKHVIASVLATSLVAFVAPAFADTPIDGAAYYSENCAQCHGRTARGSGAFPALRGKTESYLTGRLEKYRAAEQIGPNSMLMYPVAEELTDADIAALSAHIAGSYR